MEKNILKEIKQNKLTYLIGVLNILAFLSYGFKDINIVSLLEIGANFAPLSLADEPYRLLTAMFLHGSFLHLAANMYSLYFIGKQIETAFGSGVFLKIYMISGIAASLASTQYNLFAISVGASGAIFGLFGYTLVYLIRHSKSAGIKTIITNFGLYIAIVFFTGDSINFDHAGHVGGLLGGVVLAILDLVFPFHKNIGWGFLMALIVGYFLLPRYQVKYYNAFQGLESVDNEVNQLVIKNKYDQEFIHSISVARFHTDSLSKVFRQFDYLPNELRHDTTIIQNLLKLRSRQLTYSQKFVEDQSLLYYDSIAHVFKSIADLPELQHKLIFREPNKKDNLDTSSVNSQTIRVFYDENWIETEEYYAKYFRDGQIDSLGQWNGSISDFYASGAIQMKGQYSNGLKNGLFFYFNKDSTYSAIGRYFKDNRIGKWSEFHSENKIASEILYDSERPFIESLWDSLGNQLVFEGKGIVTERYKNGQLKTQYTIENGLKNGITESYFQNGNLHYKEYHEDGELLKGVSYEGNGNQHQYNIGTYIPFPEGGLELFYQNLKTRNTLQSDTINGFVHLRFDVSVEGEISNIRMLKKLGNPYDDYSKELLIEGPQWLPALEHGYREIPSQAEVFIEF